MRNQKKTRNVLTWGPVLLPSKTTADQCPPFLPNDMEAIWNLSGSCCIMAVQADWKAFRNDEGGSTVEKILFLKVNFKF